MSRLAGARAIVIGGGRGIGRATAKSLAREGATVMVCARSEAQLEATVTEIQAAGGQAVAYALDVTNDSLHVGLHAAVSDLLGGEVDILVNSAGNYISRMFLDYDVEDWRSLYDVNVLGIVRVTAAILPTMIAAGKGRIVNVASTASKWGTIGQSAYNASKHAVLGLTRALALETASHGIRVNAVCPWWVDTDLIDDEALSTVLGVPAAEVRATLASRSPIGRLITAEDVAALIVFLTLPESEAVDGIGVTLAGGALLI